MWESKLAMAQREVSGWQYAFGSSDCIAMICHFIKVITGEDHWPRWAGKYDSLHGATVHIAREADYVQPYLTNAISNVLGIRPTDIRLARRGDVVEWDFQEVPHVGIVLHTEALAFGPDGLYYVPMALCKHCWRIG